VEARRTSAQLGSISSPRQNGAKIDERGAIRALFVCGFFVRDLSFTRKICVAGRSQFVIYVTKIANIAPL
jgi:hypothetical protein